MSEANGETRSLPGSRSSSGASVTSRTQRISGSGSTKARDETVIEKHALPVLGSLPLRSITPLDVQGVVSRMSTTLKPRTVRTDYGVLRAVLSAAVDADLLTVSPCRGINLPAHVRKDIRFLSADELERLAGEMPEAYRPTVYLAGVLGLRWSEVAGLRVGRIDFRADGWKSARRAPRSTARSSSPTSRRDRRDAP